MWHANWQVYGAVKVWKQMHREGLPIARCTVQRLMRKLGLEGARRGKKVRTTRPDTTRPCPLDLVNRQFKAQRPEHRIKQGPIDLDVIDDQDRRLIYSHAQHPCLGHLLDLSMS